MGYGRDAPKVQPGIYRYILIYMKRSSTNLAKWGSSLAVRIPKAILRAAQLKLGDELEIELQDRTIVIQPAASKPNLQELLNGITPENCHPAMDWGTPVEKEVW